MSMLSEGTDAPGFSLPDQNGAMRALAEFRGSWVLLYFYPKDDTYGCTREACTLRDSFDELKALGIVVLGVSKDSVASHAGFVRKYGLPFTLLSDTDTTVMQAYGVWAKRFFKGREYMGTVRASYLIAPTGRIAKVYPKVDPDGHAEQVLADLRVIKAKKNPPRVP